MICDRDVNVGLYYIYVSNPFNNLSCDILQRHLREKKVVAIQNVVSISLEMIMVQLLLSHTALNSDERYFMLSFVAIVENTLDKMTPIQCP